MKRPDLYLLALDIIEKKMKQEEVEQNLSRDEKEILNDYIQEELESIEDEIEKYDPMAYFR